MKILVVSGFLGAGKTTFIKELIKRTGKQIAVLENEYGDTNLDSQDIQEAGELKVWEFAEGCVCCSKKDSFANTILAISASLDPEFLVVEPTGVGLLSNIMANIAKVSYEKIKALRPITIIAPITYRENMAEYGDLYTDQIANAHQVVYSKIEHEDPEYIEKVSSEIRAINPSVLISDIPYPTQCDEWWEEILSDPDASEKIKEYETQIAEATSEKTEQVSFKDIHLYNVSEFILVLEDVIRGRYGKIVRAKGAIKTGSDFVRFDIADRMYAISGADESLDNQAVFIGESPSMAGLEQALRKSAANNSLRDTSLLRRKI